MTVIGVAIYGAVTAGAVVAGELIFRALTRRDRVKARHVFPLAGQPPCPDCLQPAVVILEVGATGHSIVVTRQHRADCAAKARQGV